ncbi:MAG TPA: ABC transporter permease, partial [Gemmatimonadaceae bacterium]
MEASPGPENRAMWRTMVGGLNRDLRLAVRSLRRSPGFTIAAIAILALGIGMSTAMFATYRAVLIDRLPVIDQGRLIVMHPLDRGGAHLDIPFAYLKTIERDSAVFAGATGTHHLGARVAPYLDRDVTVPLSTATAAGNFFDVLGTRPLFGRGLRRSDAEAGAPVVIVLSYDAWRKKFHQDSSIVGHVLTSTWDGSPITIVGVEPPGLEFPTGTEAWTSTTPAVSTLQVDLVVRLRPHVTIDAARTAMKELIDRENPFTASDARAALAIQFSGVVAQPFDEEIVGRTRPVLVALTLAVGLLLLIACVNVGSLVLVRTSGRMSEIAVRRAIGASYMDIARQFFVENTVLAVLGGIGGVACALAALRVLVYFAPPQLPHVEIIRLGGVPLAAGAATTFIAVLVFGIAPSLMAASSAPYAVLRSDARGGSEGGARRRARRWLVSSQMALALVMLAGAGLLARSLNQLETLSLGYTPAHLSLLSFSGPKSIFSSPKQIIQTADQLI